MQLATLTQMFKHRGHASEVPAECIEATGRVPRGLRLLPGFVPTYQQREIAAWIAGKVHWPRSEYCGNRRETFMEGYQPLPEWGLHLGERMLEAGLFESVPNQMHLIEYQPGRGFPFHADCHDVGDVIAGLTLGSSRVLEFRRGEGPPSIRILLRPGDLYTMSGEARFRWQHGIPFTDTDLFRGQFYGRTLGMSVTWRRLPQLPERTKS